MYICTHCLSLNVRKVDRYIKCQVCSNAQSIIKYNRDLKNAEEIVRFGYQYRKRYEYDLKHNPNSKKAYYLIELNEVFSFLGLAVISGIVGNYSYAKLKLILNRLINEPLIIEIKDKEFQRFLKSDNQQRKFLKYIKEYRKKELIKSKKNIKATTTIKKKKSL